jgi:tetratricopeptide (TPR) repeat protein
MFGKSESLPSTSESTPSVAASKYQIALAFEAEGKFVEAVRCYSEAEKSITPEERNTIPLMSSISVKISKAMARIGKSQKPHGDYRFFIYLGNYYHGHSNLEMALHYYKQGRKIAPRNASIMFNISLCVSSELAISWRILAALHGHQRAIKNIDNNCLGKTPEMVAKEHLFSLTRIKPINFWTYVDKQISNKVCAIEQAKEVVRRLAEGADLNAPLQTSTAEELPLFAMISYGETQLAQQLIAAGADCAAVTSNGETALHLAVRHGLPELVPLLLARGLYLGTKNADGKTAQELDVPGASSLNFVPSSTTIRMKPGSQ